MKAPRFGKIEWSDPQLEPDHLRFLTFNSPALHGRGDVALFVPEYTGHCSSLPLVLLLHGVYCSHWAWALKGSAHRTAARMIRRGEIPPMVLAMPSDGLWGEGSAYLPHDGSDFEAWIVEDVIDCVTAELQQLDDQSPVFIAGLSLGGYGALRLGARFPKRFRGISAHSSITRGSQLPLFIARRPLSFEVTSPDDLDVEHWIRRNLDLLPPIRFDCGIEDKLIEENRALHRRMQEMGADHLFEEFPGGHNWPYWTEHLEDTLKFFGRILTS